MLYERYGDVAVLERQLDSMRAWVDHVAKIAGPERLWRRGFQFGDWLDPDAPPDKAWAGKTDPSLVATAYFARSRADRRRLPPSAGQRPDVADDYTALAARGTRSAFRDEYVTPNGRLLLRLPHRLRARARVRPPRDPSTAAAHAAAQLARGAKADYRIATGFVGHAHRAARAQQRRRPRDRVPPLTETGCPSWLYPVTMGATTIWERWDSMLPDGSINPGEMTSFNHYALGSVADWMHRTIGGLSPAEPGYRRLRDRAGPRRGPDLRPRHPRHAVRPRIHFVGARRCAVHTRGDGAGQHDGSGGAPGLDEPAVTVGAGSHRWTYSPTRTPSSHGATP